MKFPLDWQRSIYSDQSVATYSAWLPRWCSDQYAGRRGSNPAWDMNFFRFRDVCQKPPESYVHLSIITSNSFLTQKVFIPTSRLTCTYKPNLFSTCLLNSLFEIKKIKQNKLQRKLWTVEPLKFVTPSVNLSFFNFQNFRNVANGTFA